MKIKAITFTEPGKAALLEEELDTSNLAPDELLVATRMSVVSAGTELAILSGGEWWAPLPAVPGYGSVGEVLEVGADVENFKPGERIFSYASHQSANIISQEKSLIVKVPEGLDDAYAVMARIGQVSYTAPRVADAALGDYVAVIGMGLVGNLAAQLFALSGCEVIGIDVMDSRLETARACNISHTLNSAKEEDLPAAIKKITQGEMCHTVVEATGIPTLALTATTLACTLGEVVLLGTPRGEFKANATDLLGNVKLWNKCVTLKGGHEWRIDKYRDPEGRTRHSLERNVEQLMRFAGKKQLAINPLITHVLPPEECSTVYPALAGRDETYLGVLWDWRKSS